MACWWRYGKRGFLFFADALVVGNGGAARAAVYAARALGCTVTVCGRSVEKAAALRCPAVSFEEASRLHPDLIIYTLPGRAPVPQGLPFAGAVVLEAEYRIPQLSARDCRLYVSGRRWMLGQAVAGYRLGRRWMLGQAVAGYRLFTGEEPDVQEMLRAL